jgi:hypothetical protein
MKHVVSQSLHAYWDDLRAGRTAPERADVDPAAIRHILAYTFILEVTGARVLRRDVRFRLSGTRLNALFGRDLRGAALEDVSAPRDGPILQAMLDGVLDDRVPLVAWARGGPADAEAVDLELLLLPLRHHGRTHSRILGSLAAVGHPAWMGLRPTAPLSILGFQALPAQAGPVPADGVPQPRGRAPFLEGASPVPTSPVPTSLVPMAETRPARRVARGTARFRVVEGGRTDSAPGLF